MPKTRLQSAGPSTPIRSSRLSATPKPSSARLAPRSLSQTPSVAHHRSADEIALEEAEHILHPEHEHGHGHHVMADELAAIEAEQILGGTPLRRLRDDTGDCNEKKKGRGRGEVVVELNRMGAKEKRRYSTPKGKSTPSRAKVSNHDLSSVESTTPGPTTAEDDAAEKTSGSTKVAIEGEGEISQRGHSSTVTIDAVSQLAGGGESDGSDLEEETVVADDHNEKQSGNNGESKDAEKVDEDNQEDETLDDLGATTSSEPSTSQAINELTQPDTMMMSSEQPIPIDFTEQSTFDSDSDDDDESSSSDTTTESGTESGTDDDGSTSETSTSSESEDDSDEEEEKLERLLAAAKLSAKNASSSKQDTGSEDMIGLGEEEDVLQLDVEEDTNEAPIPRMTISGLPSRPILFSGTSPAQAGPSRLPKLESSAQKAEGRAVELDNRGYERPLTKREKANQPKKATPSELWSTIPSARSDLVPQMKRDYQALALANSMDPKRFMKGGTKVNKVPENFAIGTLVEQPRHLQTTTMTRERTYRPGQLLQGVVEDSGVVDYAKRKFGDLQSKRMDNGRGKGWKKRKKW